MIVATKEQGERRSNAVLICCIIGLMALSFIGCQTPEPETVEFESSGVDWELQEEALEADSSVARPSNPTLESIRKSFSGF
ncbi:MAG: hypothetical protein VX739_11875 [Planctomycetota bacterium]|nr:hypothetical protein [Planctomycetota bacterium]